MLYNAVKHQDVEATAKILRSTNVDVNTPYEPVKMERKCYVIVGNDLGLGVADILLCFLA